MSSISIEAQQALALERAAQLHDVIRENRGWGAKAFRFEVYVGGKLIYGPPCTSRHTAAFMLLEYVRLSGAEIEWSRHLSADDQAVLRFQVMRLVAEQ
ncbi:MAG TPA: hypothetical protein VH575_25225 [Gemmataceae bacterium]|jgi:hypothetical protein